MIKILAGGPKENWPADLFVNKNDDDIWIGIDYGAYALVNNGILPKKIVGDFDSLNSQQKNQLFNQIDQVDIVQVDSHKDETDTELALEVAREFLDAHQEIIVYGASGGRLDHELSNLTIFAKENLRDLVGKVILIDSQNKISYYTEGEHQIKRDPNYKYLAFMNITPVTNFEIIDALYQLSAVDNDFPLMYPSNEFADNIVNFKLDQGIMMVILSKDKA